MSKKYLIIGAQEVCPAHPQFKRNVDTYAKSISAEVLVIPYARGKYFAEQGLHQSVSDTGWTILSKDMPLGEHLVAKLMCIGAQQINPLTGIDRIVASNKSLIVGSPKQFLSCVPTVNKLNLPKVLMSTGTVTLPTDYKNTAQGVKAELDHTFGFCFLEITDKGLFNFRLVRGDKEGNFTDLTYSTKKHKCEAVVLGDIHTGHTDMTKLLEMAKLVKTLKPKYVVVHDIFDGSSINHHEEHKYLCQMNKPTLEQELRDVGLMLDQIGSWGAQVIVVKSNHDEWLHQYLDQGKYHKDSTNLKTAVNILAKVVNSGEDSLKAGITYATGKPVKAKFLGRLDSFKVRGVELGQHGDKGGNGSRGNHKQQLRMTGKGVFGHEHTPAIINDVYVVGTSTSLRLPYNSSGPSSWMNTHAAVYSDGKVQLINIL